MVEPGTENVVNPHTGSEYAYSGDSKIWPDEAAALAEAALAYRQSGNITWPGWR